MRSKNKKRVVITGIGPISAIGIGKDELWNGISKRDTHVVLDKKYLGREKLGSFFMHKVHGFNINDFGLNPYALEEIKVWNGGKENIDLYYLLAVIKLALDDSKLDITNRTDTGMILAHENPGLEGFYTEVFKKSYDLLKKQPKLSQKSYFEKLYYHFSQSAYELQTFMFLYHAAKVFNIHGFSLFTNNACSSGLYALEAATQAIKNGANNIMVVAAVDCPDLYRNLWLKNIGLYANDGIIKPFSKNRNGFICGQGGAALILEELEHAVTRKAHIYAEYLGGGFCLESWKITLPNISESFYINSILSALRNSKIKPKEVELINAHGVATQIMDQYEANAIKAVFGNLKCQPLITAFKPYIGHTLGGCALLETAILLLSLEHGIIPPVINYEQPDHKLNVNIVKEKINLKINTALKICSSFAGFDAAAIFRKYNG
jgi:3-oxoacyl-[acyl-carrier-protein] synthase II